MSVPSAPAAASATASATLAAMRRLIGTFDAPRFRPAERRGLRGCWPPMFPPRPARRPGAEQFRAFPAG